MAVDLSTLRSDFHRHLCEKLLVLVDGIATNADKDQRASVAIANNIASKLGADTGKKLAGQTAGQLFENAVQRFVSRAFLELNGIRPGEWSIEAVNSRNSVVIARYEQYAHLREVERMAKENSELAVFIGHDYNVASDIIVSRQPISDFAFEDSGLTLDDNSGTRSPLRLKNNELPILHASLSCKWTMRSDRAQNARFEALSLIRSRKGRVPHIAVITAEPTPSRLASLALGTGDIDCVYHFALPELISAVDALDQDETANILRLMVEGHRLRDISDLPLDLAT